MWWVAVYGVRRDSERGTTTYVCLSYHDTTISHHSTTYYILLYCYTISCTTSSMAPLTLNPSKRLINNKLKTQYEVGRRLSATLLTSTLTAAEWGRTVQYYSVKWEAVKKTTRFREVGERSLPPTHSPGRWIGYSNLTPPSRRSSPCPNPNFSSLHTPRVISFKLP